MTPFSIAKEKIMLRIRTACDQVNRDPNEVRLLGASKRTDATGVINAIEDGHLLFGENRAQSFRDKYQVVHATHPQAEWHFIGHLQKNKLKYIVGKATMLHSLDSLALAQSLHAKILQNNVPPIKVLIQVKLGNEDSKTGVPPHEVFPFCEEIQKLEGLRLAGLMCIPPLYGKPEDWFAQIASMAEEGREKGYPLHELSMGMSSDLEEAVKHGATIVRVGTALFCP